jgi:hypothetical protein
LKKLEYDDINTWGTIATFIGLAISVATLLIADNVRKVTRELQRSVSFDKRIPNHLREISTLLTDLNTLLNNANNNINELKTLSGLMRSELISLLIKITDKRLRLLIKKSLRQISRNIKKDFVYYDKGHQPNAFRKFYVRIFNITADNFFQSYTSVNEVYRSVDNLYKDKKTQIKK